MRTLAQILDELGSIEYERAQLHEQEQALEAELSEVEESMTWQEIEAAYDDYYGDENPLKGQ